MRLRWRPVHRSDRRDLGTGTWMRRWATSWRASPFGATRIAAHGGSGSREEPLVDGLHHARRARRDIRHFGLGLVFCHKKRRAASGPPAALT
jgi:hypothetical protein